VTGDEIKRFRGSIGATQAELGQLVHSHPVTISRWERGRAEPGRWRYQILATMMEMARRFPERTEEAHGHIRRGAWLHALTVLLMPPGRGRR